MTILTSQDGMRATELAQYLTFTLDGEFFATDITQVREVLEFQRITKVPRTPDFMRGVINLRGSVVPVLDLRRQFGMDAREPTVDTCIVIVEVPVSGKPVVFGALTDSVQEVMEIRPEQLAPPPRLGTRIRTDFIRAMARQGDQLLIILDMERILSREALVEIQQIPPPMTERSGDDIDMLSTASRKSEQRILAGAETAGNAVAATPREAAG